MSYRLSNPSIAEKERKLATLRNEAKLAEANHTILSTAADALDDPTPENIQDVQKVLREEALNFKDDATHKKHLARIAWMDLQEAKRRASLRR